MTSIGGLACSRCVARGFIVTSFRFLTRSDRRSPPICGKVARPVQRGVFLSATGRPIASFAGHAAVSAIVRYALRRAGLQPDRKGAHLLRHSLATGMLRRGGSMAEIGQILRHRLPSTTEIYAKVDMMGLRSLALPWPGRGGAQ